MSFYNPFSHQIEAIDAIFDYFQSGKKGNPLVVAPGGSGKTVTFAEFCRQVIERWPKQKILIISDDQEINSQNFETVKNQNPDIEIGLYASGLKSKTIENITIGQIQSISNKIELFEDFNLIIVDEAHKVGHDKKSRYRKFLDKLKKPTIGFTATPFRNMTGYLHLAKNAYFTDIIYTTRIKDLQECNPPRLCKISSKQPSIQLDASEIRKQAGDFILQELSLAFDREEISKEIVKDLFKYKDLRRKWLVYTIDTEHCDHVTDILNDFGIKARAVHSKTGLDRKPIVKNFRETDDYQALVSVAQLTTGVDIPEVDLIVLLRSTASAPLHCQIILRGMRVAEGKEDCLVLDYAGNLKRNGPIDAPVIRVAGEKGSGEAIMKVCDNCQELVAIATRICPTCGAEFVFQHHLGLTSSVAEVLSNENWFDVDEVKYEYYINRDNIPTMLVIYFCGLRHFRAYIPIQHGGKATYFAKHWWERRSNYPFPSTVREAVDHSNTLMEPESILVDESSKYANVKDHTF